MAATTISRPTLTDGVSDVTGDIVNAAFFGTNVYDKIDAFFVADIQWEKSANSSFTLGIRNTNAGTGAIGRVAIGNNTSASQFLLDAFSSGYTTSGSAIQSSCRLFAAGAGGLQLVASSGNIGFWPGGLAAATMISTGHLVLSELSTNPGTSDLTANGAVAVYTKGNTLVFAFNNSSVMTYVTLALDGSDTTWAQGTSAP